MKYSIGLPRTVQSGIKINATQGSRVVPGSNGGYSIVFGNEMELDDSPSATDRRRSKRKILDQNQCTITNPKALADGADLDSGTRASQGGCAASAADAPCAMSFTEKMLAARAAKKAKKAKGAVAAPQVGGDLRCLPR